MASIFQRLESWAADSPERSRLLVMLVCAVLGVLVLGFIFLLGWLVLDPSDLKDLAD